MKRPVSQANGHSKRDRPPAGSKPGPGKLDSCKPHVQDGLILQALLLCPQHLVLRGHCVSSPP